MSGRAPGASWQRPELAGEFLDLRQSLLPLIDVQEDLVLKLFERRGRELRAFLDVGAGDGAMTQLMRSAAPGAEAVLVDFSEPMLARAEQRLGPPGSGWLAVRADLATPAWRSALPERRYDAAVSSYAIHHLPSERKRELFAELLDVLEPGAMFVNMDVVTIRGPLAGLFDEQMSANAERAAGPRSGHGHGPCDDDEDDRPDPVESQLAWLREAGFAEVELHFKWAEGAVYGAVKPA